MTIEAVDTRARGLRSRRHVEIGGLTDVLRRLDWVLMAAVGGTVIYGLWAIDGITRHSAGGSMWTRQAVYVGVGAVLLAIVTFIDPEVYRRNKKFVYGGTLAVMVFVLLLGPETNGSRRWLTVPGFSRFQPSEFGKVLFTLALAAFVADRAKRMSSLSGPLFALALAAPPVLLVVAQPDLGTGLVYIAATAGVLFLGGASWKHLVAVGVVAVFTIVAVLWLLPSMGVNVLKPYQLERLTNSNSYNGEQARTAVGAGQFHGQGVEGATQVNLRFLPEPSTDFAFASLAEQRGFVGVAVLLMLYLLIVWRGLKIATRSSTFYGAIVAGALVFAFLFQVFVNVGMTIQLVPITGIPLPFVSVGGSSMITNLMAVGVLQAINVRGGRRRL